MLTGISRQGAKAWEPFAQALAKWEAEHRTHEAQPRERGRFTVLSDTDDGGPRDQESTRGIRRRLQKRAKEDRGVAVLTGAASQAQPLAHHGEIGNGRADESRVAIGHSKPANQLSPNSWDRILPRLARDAPEILEGIKKAPDLQTQRIGSTATGDLRRLGKFKLTLLA